MDQGYLCEEDAPGAAETNADRMEHWHHYVRTRQGTVGMAFGNTDNTGSDFSWSTTAQQVGRLQLVRFASDPVHYHRTRRDVRGDDDNSFRLLLPLTGEFKFSQGDSAEVVRAGKLAFFHWGSPMVMRQDEPLDALILTVPEQSVHIARARDAPLALDASRPLMRSLVSQIHQLHAGCGEWTAVDFSVAFSSALVLLDGVLNRTRAVAPGKHAVLAARAQEIMEIHASDSKLTPDAIAGICGCSLRTLHTALTESAGMAPAALLRSIRLARARQRLTSPLSVDMDVIARETGFGTTRRFRDAFRRRYEQTPEQLRAELYE